MKRGPTIDVKSQGLVSTQESLLGYLYMAVDNLERLIQNQERLLEAGRGGLSDEGDSTSRDPHARLASSWEGHIAQLRAALTKLQKMVSREERRLSTLLTRVGDEEEGSRFHGRLGAG